MIVVTLFGFAVLHTVATKCIAGIYICIYIYHMYIFTFKIFIVYNIININNQLAGDCMLDTNSKTNFEENVHFVNNFNETKVFGHGFFDQFNKIIQEIAISNSNYNNYQITDSIDKLHK